MRRLLVGLTGLGHQFLAFARTVGPASFANSILTLKIEFAQSGILVLNYPLFKFANHLKVITEFRWSG